MAIRIWTVNATRMASPHNSDANINIRVLIGMRVPSVKPATVDDGTDAGLTGDRRSPGEMEQRRQHSSGDAAALAAIALFQTVASVRPAAAQRAAQRVVLADLLTATFSDRDRSTALQACLLADFGRIVLKLPASEGAERGGNVMRAVPGLRDAAEAVAHRHERVDGQGLPSGLTGADIPVGARVVALTDLLVSQRRSVPIDWDRRLELMKDSAGTTLDVDLSDNAFELLRTADARMLVETATAGMAVAIIEQSADLAEDVLGQLGSLVEIVDDPRETAELLVEAALDSSQFRTVGVQQVNGELLSPVAVTGDPANGWAPLALTQGLAELTEPTTTAHGADHISIVPIRPGSLWGLAWGVGDGPDTDCEPLIELASAMEATVGRQNDRDRLDHLAHCDQLTGLANRRRLEATLETIFDGPAEARADVALVMCDIDGLKRVNDTRGHAAGDDVLRAVAMALEMVTRGEDAISARLGGDEFCILVKSGGILHAQGIARRAANQVRTSAPAGVGLSCGIAYAAHADTPSDLMSQADEAQYSVKRRQPRIGTHTRPIHDRRRHADR